MIGRGHPKLAVALCLTGLLFCAVVPASAQHLSGVRPIFDSMDPRFKKVWIPQQQLFSEYKWRSDEYTNYARTLYQRYTNITLEGERFYDIYGNFITRGWRVYDWSQDQGAPFGSDVVPHMSFTRVRIDGESSPCQAIVRSSHVPSRWGLTPFLDSHLLVLLNDL